MNFHQQTASGYPQPHRLFSYFPRRSRSKRLSDAAVARGRTAGLPPLIIAEMAMAACSGDFWHINQFKLFAESLIKRGPTVARSWYAGIAEAAADDLEGALVDIAESLTSLRAHVAGLRDEPTAHRNDCLGKINHLRAALLILRLMRATGHAHRFAHLREILTTPLWEVTASSADGRVVEFEPAPVSEWGA